MRCSIRTCATFLKLHRCKLISSELGRWLHALFVVLLVVEAMWLNMAVVLVQRSARAPFSLCTYLTLCASFLQRG